MRRFSSRLASGFSSTPLTTLKMAALAPIPSASVRTTGIASPLTRGRERRAKRRAVMSGISSDYSSNGIPLNRQAVRPFFQDVPVFNERDDASSGAVCCLVGFAGSTLSLPHGGGSDGHPAYTVSRCRRLHHGDGDAEEVSR